MKKISINDLPMDMEISEEEMRKVTGGVYRRAVTLKKKKLILKSKIRSSISVGVGTKSDDGNFGHCDTATAGVRG